MKNEMAETFWYVRGRRDVPTGVWLGRLREGNHIEDIDMYGRIILKLVLKLWDGAC